MATADDRSQFHFMGISVQAWVAIVLCALFAVHHVAAIFTESINWDEFGLLRRARTAAHTGYFQHGGRPGLGLLALMPFVAGCEDTIANARLCRIVWLVFSLGYPAAMFTLLRRFLSGVREAPEGAGWDAFTSLPLLLLVPLWLRWSVQVRTDQPALFCVLWAGYFMLRSREVPAWAAAAGILSTLGFLFTQKAAYTGLIVANLVIVHTLARPWTWRKLAFRCGLFALPAALTYAIFEMLIRTAFELSPSYSLETGMSHLKVYGEALQFGLYQYLLPDIVPHALLALGLIAVSVRPLWQMVGKRLEVLAAWVTVLAGLAVGYFHTTTFAYFWMTIGVFPAMALALGMGSIRAALALIRVPNRLFQGLYALSGAWLIYQSIPTGFSILEDTQRKQTEAFAFIDSNFERNEIGYQVEGGLYCRERSSPFFVTFGIHIVRDYMGRNKEKNIDAFIEQFRTTPVAFMIQSERIDVFPEPIRDFFNENYIYYRSLVRVTGKRVSAGASSVDIFVPGRYRWEPHQPADLLIDGTRLKRKATIVLKPGTYQLTSTESGVLVRDVEGEPIMPTRLDRFYNWETVRELAPHPTFRR